MGAFGAGNPFSFELGGGPSQVEQTNSALKSAVGVGGSAEDGTLEAEWRLAKARGLTAALGDERAALQFFPNLATDALPIYEEILGILAGIGEVDEARREEITALWTLLYDAAAPGLELQLQEISSLLSIIPTDRTTSRHTQLGRGFEDWDPTNPEAAGPAFGGGRSATLYPNNSSDFYTIVRYNIASGVLTDADQLVIERVKTLLNNVLPAWVGFRVITSVGFILDQSLLDVGAFGS